MENINVDPREDGDFARVMLAAQDEGSTKDFDSFITWERNSEEIIDQHNDLLDFSFPFDGSIPVQ